MLRSGCKCQHTDEDCRRDNAYLNSTIPYQYSHSHGKSSSFEFSASGGANASFSYGNVKKEAEEGNFSECCSHVYKYTNAMDQLRNTAIERSSLHAALMTSQRKSHLMEETIVAYQRREQLMSNNIASLEDTVMELTRELAFVKSRQRYELSMPSSMHWMPRRTSSYTRSAQSFHSYAAAENRQENPDSDVEIIDEYPSQRTTTPTDPIMQLSAQGRGAREQNASNTNAMTNPAHVHLKNEMQQPLPDKQQHQLSTNNNAAQSECAAGRDSLDATINSVAHNIKPSSQLQTPPSYVPQPQQPSEVPQLQKPRQPWYINAGDEQVCLRNDFHHDRFKYQHFYQPGVTNTQTPQPEPAQMQMVTTNTNETKTVKRTETPESMSISPARLPAVDLDEEINKILSSCDNSSATTSTSNTAHVGPAQQSILPKEHSVKRKQQMPTSTKKSNDFFYVSSDSENENGNQYPRARLTNDSFPQKIEALTPPRRSVRVPNIPAKYSAFDLNGYRNGQKVPVAKIKNEQRTQRRRATNSDSPRILQKKPKTGTKQKVPERIARALQVMEEHNAQRVELDFFVTEKND